MSQIRLPPRCPMNMGGACSLRASVAQQRFSGKPFAFLMLPYLVQFNIVETIMKTVVSGGRFGADKYKPKKYRRRSVGTAVARDAHFVGQGYCKICQLCWFSDFGIAELANINPNVMLEIGLMWGFGKNVIFTLDISRTRLDDMPFDLRNYMYVTYNDVERLGRNLESKVVFLLGTV